ncbi:MAG: hypothetical protein C0484_22480 [Rhodospirillum sp.]|jgi:hypothetical protein|nr:hypothetical protein [Rhodospirillum sp.]
MSRRAAAARNSAADLNASREVLIARAALERAAIRDATQDLQIASERIARIAIVGATLVRRYWLPVGLLLAGGLFKRTRPFLKMARTGLAVWQTVRLLRR